MHCSAEKSARLLPNTEIEIVNPAIPRGGFRSVLFDFDGTLSLIREGWPEVMIPMMVRVLAETGTGESEGELYEKVEEFVMRLNGKQTIYQMIQLADEVRRRGGTPLDPLQYKRQYHDLLWQRIEKRIDGLKSGTLSKDELTVPGSQALLERLRERGMRVYLASGTDLQYVQNEVEALGLDGYFGEHVYGALDDYENFSKARIVQQMLAENDLQGEQLLAFGDGFVEIEEVKRAGGVAVGVASDEVRRRGVNPWKRDRLIRAGADVIVPEYRQQERLLAYLFEK